MKSIISKIQKDISHFQAVVEKEGNDFIKRIKKLDLKTNIDQSKKELIKILNTKLKTLEPTYNSFVDEVYKNAKKAGIDLTKIEKQLKTKAKKVKKQIPKVKTAVKKTTKKKTKAKTRKTTGTTKKTTTATTKRKTTGTRKTTTKKKTTTKTST